MTTKMKRSTDKLIYYRMMTPTWLRKNSIPNIELGGGRLVLSVPQDDNDWNNILRVPLIEKGCLHDDADITVKIRVCVDLPFTVPPPPAPPPVRWVPARRVPRDPLSYTITDRKYCMGIQVLDPDVHYRTTGPYRPVEGKYGSNRLISPNTDFPNLVPSTGNVNPDVFEFFIKPSSSFGSAFCYIDDGHKALGQFARTLSLSKGLWLDLYRFASIEEYNINFIEVEIIEHTDPYGPSSSH